MIEQNYDYKEEIINTRVHYLGGSDGKLIEKVASIGYVPESAYERLAVCKGLIPPKDGIKTLEMGYGDYIENAIFDILKSDDDRWESNKMLISTKYKSDLVTLMAHPDFVLIDNKKNTVLIYECKATIDDVKRTRDKYRAQLFIETLLGKELAASLGRKYKFKLRLCHYDMNGFDGKFDPSKLTIAPVQFKSRPFDIDKGYATIDSFLYTFTEFHREDVEFEYLPVAVQEKIQSIATCLTEIKEREEKVTEFKNKIYALMTEQNIKSIKNEYFNLTRVDPTTGTSFDSKAFQADHPRVYKKYLKQSPKKGYALLKLKS